ncbi:MAG: DUF4186 domain-containing protein [Candidatus Omnitrophica bacterium]|nr:DUF4186 domain-containing protein [Candidatus Omnitrophota bacterium]
MASIVERLKKSKFRSQFRLEKEDYVYIGKTGLTTIKTHAYDFIRRRLAPREPRNDGKQTPYKGHPIFKAQHATATCCRGCLSKWYKIEKKRELKAQEIDMIVSVIMNWIETHEQVHRGTSNTRRD